MQVDFWVSDINERLLHSVFKQTSHQYGFNAEQEGTFSYCFSNQMGSVQKTLTFSVHGPDERIRFEEKYKDSKEDFHTPLNEQINRLATSLREVVDETEYLSAREAVHRMTAKSTNSRVVGSQDSWSPPDELTALLARSKTMVYAGFDPTAPSLHVGNLLTLISLLHFRLQGHDAICLLGGATGRIGDPSGRSSERTALAGEVVDANVKSIRAQVERVMANASAYARRKGFGVGARGCAVEGAVTVLDNREWFDGIGMLEFLETFGKYARVSVMLAKDSVKSRLDSPEGISFTEFTYQLLQAYDFYHLNRTRGCTIQLGGSDQWGNIAAGIELVHKKWAVLKTEEGVSPQERSGEDVYGVTMPLVTTAQGEKFGKSAGNAVWLDEGLVSHFDFYQFFRRTPDTEVERYLMYFTLLPLDEIHAIMGRLKAEPKKHIPQRALAFEVTELVHGAEAAKNARVMSEVLFDSKAGQIPNVDDVIQAFEGDARLVTMPRSEFVGLHASDVAIKIGAIASPSMLFHHTISWGLITFTDNGKE
ncbi:tyrosyl-tRNA synthetase [Irineochytrium annulatum]|nr:tyrosyl-tRNA synthetase [Irineochytrium annulatum]